MDCDLARLEPEEIPALFHESSRKDLEGRFWLRRRPSAKETGAFFFSSETEQ